ncbi:MAG TPA: TetR/AcrR family transcriptional regulator, partial [bacterium]
RVATRDGLEGLSIGTLATDLGLSKSGLFAHFGSKEALQVEVLKAGVARFEAVAIRPALSAPRGEPRVQALFDHWLGWMEHTEEFGGCLITAASVELDDRPGPPRDYLAYIERQHMGVLAKAVRMAIDEGHFQQEVDPKQFAFEWKGIILAYHETVRLMRDPAALTMARNAFARLMASARKAPTVQ